MATKGQMKRISKAFEADLAEQEEKITETLRHKFSQMAQKSIAEAELANTEVLIRRDKLILDLEASVNDLDIEIAKLNQSLVYYAPEAVE